MPNTDPVTVMLADITQRLQARPFQPFVLKLSDGTRHKVPTSDHCTVSRLSRRLTVDHDDGSFVAISALHVTQLGQLRRKSAGRTARG